MTRKTTSATDGATRTTRYLVIAVFAVVLFAVSYAFASSGSGSPATAGTVGSSNDLTQTGGSDGSSAACACCGGAAGSSEPIEGTAAVEAGVQRIDVDLSSGSYNPNVLILKAGVPSEITFGQSGGCTAQVMSQDLGFFEDLTAGPRTVKVGALEPGEYEFSCGMQMVFGKVVVQ